MFRLYTVTNILQTVPLILYIQYEEVQVQISINSDQLQSTVNFLERFKSGLIFP